MPTIKVSEPTLLSLIKVESILSASPDALPKAVEEAVFDYGIELEGIEMLAERHTPDVEVRHYKFDVPANRPDLCCAEGIALGLNIYHGAVTLDDCRVTPIEDEEMPTLTVRSSAPGSIRPFARGCVLKQMLLTPAVYNSFIDFQDKLHHNVCRRRRLVAIGTHDMSKMRGEISYGLEPPADIRFVPLNHKDERDGNGVLDEYRADPALADFVPILDNQPLFPVYRDGEGVLSMPPLINSDRTKMAAGATPTDIFIDISATDARRADLVLATIVACFAQHCQGKYKNRFLPVRLVNADAGASDVVPDMTDLVMDVPRAEITRVTGLDLPVPALAELLGRMNVDVCLDGPADAAAITCRVPLLRSDVLHPIDIAEDVAIAYGLGKLPHGRVPVSTTGSLLPRTRISEHVRTACAALGLTEVCNFSLSHPDHAVLSVLTPPDPASVATVNNAKVVEYSALRTGLVGGLLRVAALNNVEARPLSIFEVGEVLSMGAAVGRESVDRLPETTARCGVLMSADPAPFSELHGVLDALMFGLDRAFRLVPDQTAPAPFLQGRSAAVVGPRGVCGRIGIIHPAVLAEFKITWPIAYFEIEI